MEPHGKSNCIVYFRVVSTGGIVFRSCHLFKRHCRNTILSEREYFRRRCPVGKGILYLGVDARYCLFNRIVFHGAGVDSVETRFRPRGTEVSVSGGGKDISVRLEMDFPRSG